MNWAAVFDGVAIVLIANSVLDNPSWPFAVRRTALIIGMLILWMHRR